MDALKRVPAVSRALGESDSDDESMEETTEELLTGFQYLDINNDIIPDVVNLLRHQNVTQLVVALGPLQTAFVSCLFNLSSTNVCARVPLPPSIIAKSDFKYSCLHLVNQPSSNASATTAVITVPISNHPLRVQQRNVVEKWLTDLSLSTNEFNHSSADLDVIILCSQSAYQFFSSNIYGPQRELNEVPFLRCLNSTLKQKHPKHTPTPLLETPNMVSGMPAEFLSWFKMRSIPATLYILYYAPHENVTYAWSAVKELFAAIGSACRNWFSTETVNWDSLDDERLKEACIQLVSGNRPTKMDQMYT